MWQKELLKRFSSKKSRPVIINFFLESHKKLQSGLNPHQNPSSKTCPPILKTNLVHITSLHCHSSIISPYCTKNKTKYLISFSSNGHLSFLATINNGGQHKQQLQLQKKQMHPSFCTSLPSSPSTSISKFISDHPCLTMLENSCTTMADLHKLHGNLIKTGLARDTIAASRLLAFCATSPAGDINYAYSVFSQIQHPNLFTWNTIIRGFSQSSAPQNAISLFIDMLQSSPIEPHRLTYPSLFKAYAQLGLAHDGTQLHGRVLKLGLETDPFVRNTIIFMYANCGFLSEASRLFDEDSDFDVVAWNSMIMGLAKSGQVDESRRLFDKMESRSTVTWNSMISGYVRNGRAKEAFDLFFQMQNQKIHPTEFTMASLLNTCGRLGALEQGEWIHAYIRKSKIEVNSIVLTAMVDMYCKCGTVNKALQVFVEAPKKGLSTWNSMIMGLAINGRGEEAIEMFSRLQSSGLEPDDVSFIGVLTACNHCGMVKEARRYFSLMNKTCNFKPTIKHYSCMVDVLGRAGFLEEAKELIASMPENPDAITWASLLSACRKYGNVEMAKRAAEQLLKLEPSESCTYVLLSNTYGSSARFEDAVDARLLMQKRGLRKEPGCSLIEVNGEVHELVAGGVLHPQVAEIHALLDELSLMLKEMEHTQHGTLNFLDIKTWLNVALCKRLLVCCLN